MNLYFCPILKTSDHSIKLLINKVIGDIEKKQEIQLLDAQTQGKGKDSLKKSSIGQMISDKQLDQWHGYWIGEQMRWYSELGVSFGKLKVREHTKDELSHYSSGTFDIDYDFPFGSKEIAGNADRGQYDIAQHIKESGQKLELFDEESKEKVRWCS